MPDNAPERVQPTPDLSFERGRLQVVIGTGKLQTARLAGKRGAVNAAGFGMA
jgi:hypothetical protein